MPAPSLILIRRFQNEDLARLNTRLQENLLFLANESPVCSGEYSHANRWSMIQVKVERFRSIVQRHFSTFFDLMNNVGEFLRLFAN